jgi:hypothetical protein
MVFVIHGFRYHHSGNHEANIRGSGKTIHVVFKYCPEAQL